MATGKNVGIAVKKTPSKHMNITVAWGGGGGGGGGEERESNMGGVERERKRVRKKRFCE